MSVSRLTAHAAAALAIAIAAATSACTQARRADSARPEVRELRAVEARSEHGMIATGTADSSRIGARILEAGGNAVDAAVAAAFALAVVDPGDSGLGGMTLALVRLADGRTVAVDGWAKVPMRIDADRIAELQQAKVRRALEYTAAPTSLATLAYLSERYGTMPLADLIMPAVEVAEGGFTQTTFQISSMERYLDSMLQSEHLRFLVLDNGTDLPSLEKVYFRPKFAECLRRIARRGAADFYRGSMAAELVADISRWGGFVTLQDLGLARVRELTPATGTYRGLDVFAFPSPGSGGAVVEALNILEQFPVEQLRGQSVDRLQILIESFRIALGDRRQFRPDPNLPDGHRNLHFLTKEFAAERAAMIHLGTALPQDAFPPPSPCVETDTQTTHVSVVDRWGNTVSMTQTLSNFYGAQEMHPDLEIPYNNLLEGVCDPVPRTAIVSDMAPTIVVRDGAPLLALGSAGSSRIPAIIALVVSNVVDGGMGVGEAVQAPRMLWGGRRLPPLSIEVRPPVTKKLVRWLEDMGYTDIATIELPSPLGRFAIYGGVNAVYRDPSTGVLIGVGDPRRECVALGAAH